MNNDLTNTQTLYLNRLQNILNECENDMVHINNILDSYSPEEKEMIKSLEKKTNIVEKILNIQSKHQKSIFDLIGHLVETIEDKNSICFKFDKNKNNLSYNTFKIELENKLKQIKDFSDENNLLEKNKLLSDALNLQQICIHNLEKNNNELLFYNNILDKIITYIIGGIICIIFFRCLII